MATAKTTTKRMSIGETAELFCERGMHVINYHRGDEGPVNMVVFRGDDDAAQESLEIARSLGLYPHLLRRVWDYVIDQGENPYWELLFFYREPIFLSDNESDTQ